MRILFFLMFMLCRPGIKAQGTLPGGGIPPIVDYTEYCPPVIQQGNENNCAAYSISYYSMSIMYNKLLDIKDKNKKTELAFSPDYIYQKLRTEAISGLDAKKVLQSLMTEGNKKSVAKTAGSHIFKIKEFDHLIDKKENEKIGIKTQEFIEKIKNALISGHVVNAIILPANSFIKCNTKVYVPAVDDNSNSEHMVTVIGYDNRIGAFKIVNSWGEEWADGGYAYVIYSDFIKMIRHAYIFTIDSTDEMKKLYMLKATSGQKLCTNKYSINFDELFEKEGYVMNRRCLQLAGYIDGKVLSLELQENQGSRSNINQTVFISKRHPGGQLIKEVILSNKGAVTEGKITVDDYGNIHSIIVTNVNGKRTITYRKHQFDFTLRDSIQEVDSYASDICFSNILTAGHKAIFVYTASKYLASCTVEGGQLKKSFLYASDLEQKKRIKDALVENAIKYLYLHQSDGSFIVTGIADPVVNKISFLFSCELKSTGSKFEMDRNTLKELRIQSELTNGMIRIHDIQEHPNNGILYFTGHYGCEPIIGQITVESGKADLKAEIMPIILKEPYILATGTSLFILGEDQIGVVITGMANPETMTANTDATYVKYSIKNGKLVKENADKDLHEPGNDVLSRTMLDNDMFIAVYEVSKYEPVYFQTFRKNCNGKDSEPTSRKHDRDKIFWHNMMFKYETKNESPVNKTVVSTADIILEKEKTMYLPYVMGEKVHDELCHAYLEIRVSKPDLVETPIKIRLSTKNNLLKDTLWIPVKNIALGDMDSVVIIATLMPAPLTSAYRCYLIKGKDPKVIFNGSYRLLKNGAVVNLPADNNEYNLEISIDDLSNTNTSELSLNISGLGNSFFCKEGEMWKIGKNQIKKEPNQKKWKFTSTIIILDSKLWIEKNSITLQANGYKKDLPWFR